MIRSHVVASMVCCAWLAVSASGQVLAPAVPTVESEPGLQEVQSVPARGQAAPILQRAGDLIGSGVRTMQGEELGRLHEIVIEPETGEVKYAVLSVGGAMGVGATLHAVPIQALQRRPDGDHVVLNVKLDQLKESKGFEADAWPDAANVLLADPQLAEPVNGGEAGRAGEAGEHGATHAAGGASGATQRRAARPGDPGNVAAGDRTVAEARAAEGAQTPGRGVTGSGAGEASGDLAARDDANELERRQQTLRERALAEHAKIVPLDRENLWSHKASALRGLGVWAKGEAVGEVSDLVIDMAGGRVAYMLVSYGGTLGVGDRKVAAPWHAVKLDRGDRVAVVNADRAALDQLAFAGGEMPDLNDPQWVERTRRAFGDEPRQDVFGYSIEGQDRDAQQKQERTEQAGQDEAPRR